MSITKILDEFLASDDRVAVIKGEWGVGKTHFWNRYYEDKRNKREIEQIAYSYVSLFGLNSIGEIKKKLFPSTIPLNQKIYREDLLEKKQQMMERFFSGVYKCVRYNKVSKKIFNNFSIGISGFGLKSSEFTIFDGYNYVSKYLICFDDLERKGSSLEIKDFMGLVDDLARSKACKIILIYNENNLTKNDEEKQFIEYREKIVDRDIMYKPDVIDNIRKIFPHNDPNFEFINSAAEALNLKNIRILNKIKKTLYAYESEFTTARREVRKDFTFRVVLFAYVFYSGAGELPYDEFFKKIQPRAMADSYHTNDDEMSDTEKFIEQLDISFTNSDNLFDYGIDYYFKHGYLLSSFTFESAVKAKNKDYEDIEINRKLDEIWSVFRDSFNANQDDFVNALKGAIEEYMSRIPLRKVSSIFIILEELGVNCDRYITQYVDDLISRCSLNKEYNLLMNSTIEHKGLYELINDKFNQIRKNEYDLDVLLDRLSNSNSYSSLHIDALNAYSEDDYYNWIITCNENVLDKIRHGLLKFDDHVAPIPGQTQITDKAIAAIKRVARTSQLNKIRVERLLKIKID